MYVSSQRYRSKSSMVEPSPIMALHPLGTPTKAPESIRAWYLGLGIAMGWPSKTNQEAGTFWGIGEDWHNIGALLDHSELRKSRSSQGTHQRIQARIPAPLQLACSGNALWPPFSSATWCQPAMLRTTHFMCRYLSKFRCLEDIGDTSRLCAQHRFHAGLPPHHVRIQSQRTVRQNVESRIQLEHTWTTVTRKCPSTRCSCHWFYTQRLAEGKYRFWEGRQVPKRRNSHNPSHCRAAGQPSISMFHGLLHVRTPWASPQKSGLLNELTSNAVAGTVPVLDCV